MLKNVMFRKIRFVLDASVSLIRYTFKFKKMLYIAHLLCIDNYFLSNICLFDISCKNACHGNIGNSWGRQLINFVHQIGAFSLRLILVVLSRFWREIWIWNRLCSVGSVPELDVFLQVILRVKVERAKEARNWLVIVHIWRIAATFSLCNFSSQTKLLIFWPVLQPQMLQGRGPFWKDLDRMLAKVAPETSLTVENALVNFVSVRDVINIDIYVIIKFFIFIICTGTSVVWTSLSAATWVPCKLVFF